MHKKRQLSSDDSYWNRSHSGTMKATLLSAVALALIVSCLALDCPGCDISACKDPGPCRHGTTLDFCACCTVCYKGIGEECGGPWNVFGVCAHLLSCIKLPEPGHEEDAISDFNAKGKCLALPK